MTATYKFETLAGHDREHFESGDETLDRYFNTSITQDVRRRAASAVVAIGEGDQVAGFYTLAATSIALAELPSAIVKRLPRYPLVPCVLIGRLAVARSHQGAGLGGLLLANAARRVLESGIGAHSLVVRPKNDAAAAFYGRYGFAEMGGQAGLHFLPLGSFPA